ncbi:bifunctional serine/threonine-protein kinase/formylglycine-generating enzyme family protein [Chondromyces crocatus]|uniref:Protein kinase domain-containing protein n=1 Tax=Chondromyces crocatus TaxID=52 RepID=A0A0K1E8J3_CHOCO|nr:serine/threonine protein kinase [Chondromyces crocatus]AKT37007.1 uncharacterized protein CMC5_011330 [Chondromyces crocatus]
MGLELNDGSIIEGRYRLARVIAENDMGTVWSAVRLDGGPPVAIKLFSPTAARGSQVNQRLLREARAAAALRHPSAITIHEVLVLADGTPAIVTDLLNGETLRTRLQRERRIDLPEMSRIMLPVISAVGAAHSLGIVHRDLRPETIFLVEPGLGQVGSARVKVLDLGITRITAVEGEAARIAGQTEPGTLLGTPHYMAPEQILGTPEVDYRADVWSLGVVLYEALTGVRPLDGSSTEKILKRILAGTVTRVRLVAPQVPSIIALLLEKMLTVDREQRPSLQEIGKVLVRFGNVTFRPFGPPARARTASGEFALVNGLREEPSSVSSAGVAGDGTPLPDVTASSSLHDEVSHVDEGAATDRFSEPGRFSDPGRFSEPGGFSRSELGAVGILPDEGEASPASPVSSSPAVATSNAATTVTAAASVADVTTAAIAATAATAQIEEVASSRRPEPPTALHQNSEGTHRPGDATPAAPPQRWTSLLGGAAILMVGSALILWWQRPTPGGSCPQGMAQVGEQLCLDEREVTAARYAACAERGQCLAHAPAPSGAPCAASPPAEAEPAARCVRRDAAEALCRAEGKRLPSQEEWTQASAAVNNSPYPFASTEPAATFRCAAAPSPP